MAAASSRAKGAAVWAAERFVKEELAAAAVDSSHDWWHIHRVRNLALELAGKEELPESSLEVVELAALLHDIKDWKYSKDSSAGANAVQEFLLTSCMDISSQSREQITYIVQNIGYKDELAGRVDNPLPELCVVQDADRLDAIGAIGIARCLTFGGRFNRALHDPDVQARDGLTREEYMSDTTQQTTINHFYEKLLKLRDMMKTKRSHPKYQHISECRVYVPRGIPELASEETAARLSKHNEIQEVETLYLQAGRAMAEDRHRYMEEFLSRFYAEWEGTV